MDKEKVRQWLAARREQRQPPPGMEQIRAEIGWTQGRRDDLSGAGRREQGTVQHPDGAAHPG